MLITDLLLAPECVGEALRDPRGASALALIRAQTEGIRIWLAAGAIGAYRAVAPSVSGLTGLAATCQWLSALSCDMDPGINDPIANLLERGLSRLGSTSMLLGRGPGAMTPESLLALDIDPRPIAFIDLAAQQDRIRPEHERRIDAVLRHGHYIMGPEIGELESRLADYVGMPHAITVASGTDSLEIAYRALGIGHDEEIVTVPFTWISTAETILQVGARPVFCDIDPASFNMDAARLPAAITPRTKAIVPVSLFGQPCEAERIIDAAHGLPVIEDAAQSFGSTRHGRRSCALTRIASTSFFPAKPLGCYGDGGCLFTNDDALAARMRAIRTHGGERRHHHPYVGMNGRMDTLQAAIVLAKLPIWHDEVAARNRIGAHLSARLVGHVGVPEVVAGNTHVYAQYTIRTPDRDGVAERLKGRGIPTAIYYPKCLHEQPIFAAYASVGDLPEAEKASREVLSLPMHPHLDDETQDLIVAAVKAVVGGAQATSASGKI